MKKIFKGVYEDKVIHTTLRKHTMKKLIIEFCIKTAFRFNNNIYKKIDGVSMGSPFGRVLANIIMTKLEKFTVKNFVETSLITVYVRYVDDTLLFAKVKYMKLIH